ncbi:hypothetical protein SSX86_020219 [Deinandra increscens subsp. villosa]|uniref:Transferase, Chloramphenicol acetyltransferase-like domain protein n=1 Tax=Deinandra increscens subsp. villosa TaxID=3103831 RepID=A0AAP0CML0_9ASTR
MEIIRNMVRCGQRHLHTIVSRKIIKPSSPTPSRLKTYNLSLFDQLAPDAYMPMVIFYPNSKLHANSHVKMMDMKNSLSRTLTQYYPFAGRLAKTTPSFVDCNDEGVEFLEAHNDNLLSDFLNNTQYEDLDQLFPNGLVWQQLRSCSFEKDRASPLAIQVNQFACGGIAVAVSLSHKIADGSSLCNFFNDWAIMTRLSSREEHNGHGSPINPYFISFKNTNLNYQGIPTSKSQDGAVTRSFVFPNSRLNDLKLKVIKMTTQSEQPITNPTRMEVLNWLLYKCAIKAARKNNLGSFKPTRFALATEIRNKMTEPLPKTTIGNIVCLPAFSTDNPNQTTPSNFISQLKNLKMEVQGFQNIQDAIERLQHTSDLPTIVKSEQRKVGYYLSSSLCWYPLHGIDFGWGKPIKVVPSAVTPMCNRFVFVDARNGDGIEVFVSLGKQDMEIFQTDPELLAFC